MRAVRLHALGGPENLTIDDLPVPDPAAGEVLVRVRAAALNHRDLFITRGQYPKIALPVTLGSDGAGEIAGLGAGVAGVAVGDAVVLYPMLGWGDDPQLRASDATILGMPHAGTFAEYVTLPAANVARKPGALSMEAAAAIPLGGLTAYRALFTRGALRCGETVLLPGIGGGVQTFALLFAKRAGARVIVTSSSDEKLARARALGADASFNYRENDAWEKAARSAGPVDLVVDSSGGATLGKALALLRPGGRAVLYGGTHGEATIKLFPLFWNELDVLGSTMGSPHDFREMLALFNDGLEPVVDRIYALDEIVAAMHRMDEAAQFGKIVVRIA
jgi:zinc-binding alcohol dehydrogenase/oxidoreductase